MAEASEKKRQQLREAFGIREDYVEGSAFNFGQQNQQLNQDKEKCVFVINNTHSWYNALPKTGMFHEVKSLAYCMYIYMLSIKFHSISLTLLLH